MAASVSLAAPVAPPGSTGARFSDWDLYAFGLRVGARALAVAPSEGLKALMLPVEYVRCAESRYVLQHLDAEAGQRVLDVGSPKLPSLFLAARVGARVDATDLMDYFFARYGAYARAVLGARQDLYRMAAQDARCLSYADGSFDRAYSISAIEHIPDDGDSVAMAQIARVLKPGGICCLTVPWGLEGYVEEFRSPGDPDTYWVRATERRIFYQRAYDRESLETRLLDRGRFDVLDVSFWGERKLPVEHVILSRKLPRWVRWALLPAHFPLSRLFLSELREGEPCRKKIACLTLRKRARAA